MTTEHITVLSIFLIGVFLIGIYCIFKTATTKDYDIKSAYGGFATILYGIVCGLLFIILNDFAELKKSKNCPEYEKVENVYRLKK
jgi:hypothetical protein